METKAHAEAAGSRRHLAYGNSWLVRQINRVVCWRTGNGGDLRTSALSLDLTPSTSWTTRNTIVLDGHDLPWLSSGRPRLCRIGTIR
jgi:hypothetical protein